MASKRIKMDFKDRFLCEDDSNDDQGGLTHRDLVDPKTRQIVIISKFLSDKVTTMFARKLFGVSDWPKSLMKYYTNKIYKKYYGTQMFNPRDYKIECKVDFMTPDGWDMKIDCEFPPLLTSYRTETAPVRTANYLPRFPQDYLWSFVWFVQTETPSEKVYYSSIYPKFKHSIVHIMVIDELDKNCLDVLSKINKLKESVQSRGSRFVLMCRHYNGVGNLQYKHIDKIYKKCGVRICFMDVLGK